MSDDSQWDDGRAARSASQLRCDRSYSFRASASVRCDSDSEPNTSLDKSSMSPDEMSKVLDLCRATELGKLSEIDELVQKGTPVDGDRIRHIPVAEAITYQNSASFFHLLAAGASVHLRTIGYTLAEAVALGSGWSVATKCQGLDFIAARGLVLPPIHQAAVKGDLSTILQEIEGGKLLQKDSKGNTVVTYLCSCGHFEILHHLQRIDPSLFSLKNIDGSTPLLFAAENGQIKTVQWLLKEGGAKISEVTPSGTSAFDMAAINGHLETAKWLFSEGGSVASTRTDSLFLTIVSSGPLGFKTAKWMVETGKASILEKDGSGFSANYYAAGSGYLESLQWLVQSGCPTECENTTLLIWSAANGNLDCVKWLISKGSKITERDQTGLTPFLAAASEGRLKVVKWLLQEGGSSITEQDKDGETALLLSASAGYFSTVQFLLKEGGALISESSSHDADVLFCAAWNGHLEIVRWLLQEYRDVVKKSSALLPAAQNGHLEVVKWVVEKEGILVTEVIDQGMTALMCAASQGHMPVVKWLVKHGKSNPLAKDDLGDSALFFAVSNSQLEVVKWLLIEGGSTLSERDQYGWTVFMRSVNSVEILEYLLKEWGADATEKTESGLTALLWAATLGFVSAVKFLLRHAGSKLTETSNDGSSALEFAIRQGKAHMVTSLVVDFDAALPSKLKEYASVAEGDCISFCNNLRLFQAVCIEYDVKQRLPVIRCAVIELLQGTFPSVLRDLVNEYLEQTEQDLSQLHDEIVAKHKSQLTYNKTNVAYETKFWLASREILQKLFQHISAQSSFSVLELRNVINVHISLNKQAVLGTFLEIALNEALDEMECFLGEPRALPERKTEKLGMFARLSKKVTLLSGPHKLFRMGKSKKNL